MKNSIINILGFIIMLSFNPLMIGQSITSEKQLINIGFSSNIFNEVDVLDARAAIEVWVNELVRDVGEKYNIHAEIFYNIDEIAEAIKSDKVHLVSLLSMEYYELTSRVNLDPAIVTGFNDQIGFKYLLLTGKNISGLKELKGKTINIISGDNERLLELWLDSILNDEGIKTADIFFKSIKKVNKASQAVLPVFFKQTDACIIKKYTYDIMVELNPQLDKELHSIIISPSLIEGIMCLNSTISMDEKEFLLSIIRKFPETKGGNQILKLFQQNKLAFYKPEHLEFTESLINKYIKRHKSD